MQKQEIEQWADSGTHGQWEHPGEPWRRAWLQRAVRSQSPSDLFCASCGQCCNNSSNSMLRAWGAMVLTQCLLLFLGVLQAQDTQSAPIQGQRAGRQADTCTQPQAGSSRPGLRLAEPERLHRAAWDRHTTKRCGGGCNYFGEDRGFLTSREVGSDSVGPETCQWVLQHLAMVSQPLVCALSLLHLCTHSVFRYDSEESV